MKISLWNKTFAIDALVGQCQISTLDPFDELTLELIGKKETKTGKIRILIENFENLEEIWLWFLWSLESCDIVYSAIKVP